jgi:hypothetical protein
MVQSDRRPIDVVVFSAAQLDELREAARAAAYEETIRALRDRRVAPPARHAPPPPAR